MKRRHIHVGVENLTDSIKFYSALFGAEPARIKDDFAKWMLDDPRLNFAISTRAASGVDHPGLQVDDEHELAASRERLKQADMSSSDEGETLCCHARSDQSWITDPAGIASEAFQIMDAVQLFSDASYSEEEVCCAPEIKGQPGCREPSGKTAGCCA